MNFTVAYRSRSGVSGTPGGMALSFAPNLRRDRVSFVGDLRDPLRFREAVSALHAVVVSDLKYKPKDRSAYQAYLKRVQEREQAIRQLAFKQSKERLLAEDIEFFVADVRDIPADPKIQITLLGKQPGHLFVRAGHALAGLSCTFAEAWRFGVAATKLPTPLSALVAHLVGLPPGEEPVLALECDDIALLRTLALTTDTVLATSDAAVRDDVAAGSLVRVVIEDLPDVYSEMGVVSLVNRTPSPMAQRAIECVREIAKQVNVPAP